MMNNRTLGINFSTRKEEYLSCWFGASREPAREELRLEVNGYGIPALYVRPEPDGRGPTAMPPAPASPPSAAPSWR